MARRHDVCEPERRHVVHHRLARHHHDVDDLRDGHGIIRERLPLRVGARRDPGASVTALSSSSIDLTLDYFVDNVIGDYFERVDDVRTDLLQSILVEFTHEAISIPFQQIEVRHLDGTTY